jgi:hypothetical protein
VIPDQNLNGKLDVVFRPVNQGAHVFPTWVSNDLAKRRSRQGVTAICSQSRSDCCQHWHCCLHDSTMSQSQALTIGRGADFDVENKWIGGRENSYATQIAAQARPGSALEPGVRQVQFPDHWPIAERWNPSQGLALGERTFRRQPRRSARSSTSACSQNSKSLPAGPPAALHSRRARRATSPRPSSTYA